MTRSTSSFRRPRNAPGDVELVAKLPTEAAVEPHVETSGSVLPAHLDRDLLRGVVAWNAASAGAYGL